MTSQNRIFLFLAITIAILFVFVIIFAVFTLYLRLRNMRTAERWQRMEAKWEPQILDLLTGVQSIEDVQKRVGKQESLYFLDFLQRFAQRLRGAEATVLKQLAAAYLPVLAERAKDADPPRRARAIRTLSILGLEPYGETVRAALDDPSPWVAMIAARALAGMDHPEYAEAILDRFHRFEDWSQNLLVSMLSSMGPGVTPALRRTLGDRDEVPRVRAVAADALRDLNDLAVGDQAAGVLETETERDLLAATLRLLGVVGRPDHLEPVRRLCRSDDFVVRASAFGALGRLGGNEDWSLLRSGIDDDSPWVALQAARGLTEAGGEEILEELIAAGRSRSILAREILAEGRPV
ncbi:MAG: HEAT repeat domain-containing protein [Candidatus Marinimicrobia bacterium]|nr:HEAT repeat domain-containing protein [Candidatus Neomarinimicrobiota bacterium]